ncbi:protein KRI1 homolog [Agrilus planipennis]|uniref:Protein KRI1 homolog n=1 Tax=Agrilus planipennis TaxID=224129 RepID=A0A7F5R539_AGRPL|nr:protein KRI1 homolog [Agrilus planipennis]
MLGLFDENGDGKVSLQTNNEYAKNYNKWRKKEELHKLKTKYGEEAVSDYESTSSSEEEDIEVNNEFEIEFLKALSCLKTKDPSVYDENTKFFENVETTLRSSKEKGKQPMYLKDYERKLIMENSGQLSDEDDDKTNVLSLTICEEQEQIKNELKDALENIPGSDKDNNWGGLFKQRLKTEEEKTKEEEDYKLWLAGQKQHLEDKSIENQLQPLKDFWNDPNLDEKEKFLRDYILKNRFNDDEENGYIPTYDEIIHDSDEGLSEDENAITEQEEFENKYNFRFEEPDQEFLKRYPRTMESSLRRKDDKRKMKREEVKERKKKEKMQKMEEIKQLKALKKREIEEKIEMLKEITGNNEIGFNVF